MGNRSGLNPDSQDVTLDEQALEDLVKQSQAQFGLPTQIFASPSQYNSILTFFGTFGYESYPEYLPTPWARVIRLTKREKRVAALHTILAKLNVFKNLTEDNLDEIKDKSVRRLRRAKWARYQR